MSVGPFELVRRGNNTFGIHMGGLETVLYASRTMHEAPHDADTKSNVRELDGIEQVTVVKPPPGTMYRYT